MASYEPVIKNGASGAIFYVALKPRTATGHFQTNPTLASGDVKISIDGGAFANLGTLPDVEPNAGSAVRVILSQAETNGDNLVIQFIDAAGDEWNDLQVNIQTAAANFDSLNTLIDALPTNAELATALGTADDAVLTAIDDLPTNAELATALGTADDAVLTQIALVKAKTDSLTFTVAGMVDSNIQYVNDVLVTGDGQTGTEWGP